MKTYIKQINLALLLLLTTACTHQIKPVEGITSVADDPRGIEKWVLQNAYSLKSSTHAILALVSENQKVPWSPTVYQVTHAPMPYGSSYQRSWTKNILFINKVENNSSWLFRKNNQLIVESFTFPQNNHPPFMHSKTVESKVILYKVINRDTNADKKINLSDNQDLAISDTAGKRYTVLVKGIGRIISMESIDENAMMIVYQKAGVGYSLKLSLDSFEILSDVLLPKVGE